MYVHLDDIVRLVGGSLYNEGRVEVKYNRQWGTVCDDGWDDTDAGVVCRQLGFGSSGTAIGSAGFGQGSGSLWLDSVTCTGNESTLTGTLHRFNTVPTSFPILLDEVRCDGNETNILACPHLRLNKHDCNHGEDVGVICTGLYS